MSTISDTHVVHRGAARALPPVRSALRPALGWLAAVVSSVPSATWRRALVERVYGRDCELVTDALGSRVHTPMTLAGIPFDLDPAPSGRIDFEDLAGLLPSTAFAFGVALMTPRQLAYVFGLARRSGVRTAIEIGRFKGGATVTLAAAIAPAGTLWSIDNGSLELAASHAGPRHDDQIRSVCARLGLDVRLVVGDSRVLELDTGPADIVLIDGDHRYEGVASDIARWGKRVRVAGHVLLDDAFPLGDYRRGCDDVARAVREAVDEGTFTLVRAVDRMAHLQRVR